MRRRTLTTLGLAALCGHKGAMAAGFPERPVRMLVGSSAGSSPDAIARLVAAGMTFRLGQPVIVENKPGASTSIATERVVTGPADGYLMGYATPSLVLNAALQMKLPFSLERDLQPVVQLGAQPLALAVAPNCPFKDIEQLIDAARRKPGTLTFASTGPGSIFHLAFERLATATGVKFLHVPYLSGPQAMTDLMGGAIDCMFNALNALLPQFEAGRLRGLAITTRDRSSLLPDLPAIAERLVPGFDVRSWGGIVVASKTPATIVAQLNSAANFALVQPQLVDALRRTGYEIAGGTPEAFKSFLRDESSRWGEVVASSGLTLR